MHWACSLENRKHSVDIVHFYQLYRSSSMMQIGNLSLRINERDPWYSVMKITWPIKGMLVLWPHNPQSFRACLSNKMRELHKGCFQESVWRLKKYLLNDCNSVVIPTQKWCRVGHIQKTRIISSLSVRNSYQPISLQINWVLTLHCLSKVL